MPKAKWKQGKTLTFKEACKTIREGRIIYYRHKAYCSGWARGWPLGWFMSQCKMGYLREALPVNKEDIKKGEMCDRCLEVTTRICPECLKPICDVCKSVHELVGCGG